MRKSKKQKFKQKSFHFEDNLGIYDEDFEDKKKIFKISIYRLQVLFIFFLFISIVFSSKAFYIALSNHQVCVYYF